MNITLSADKILIKKSRAYAREHDTSLNQLVRDYLQRLTGGTDVRHVADEFVSLAHSMAGKSDADYVFSRDAVYNRHDQE